MSTALNTIEGLFGTILFHVVAAFSFIHKSWLPLVAFSLLVLIGGALKIAYLPTVAVNEQAVAKKYWFAFGALVMLFIFLAYDGFIK